MQVEQFLPIQPIEGDADVNLDYIFEPSKEEIVLELIPKSAFGGEYSSEGPYKGCRIIEWWQDANTSWWVKVRVDGQYKWVPYQEVSSPSPKQQRSEEK